MTLRTKSRGRQWRVWGGLSLVALTVAAVWSFLATGSVCAGYFHPTNNRLALPFFALFVYLAWEMRWDGKKVKSEGQGRDEVEKAGGGGERKDSFDPAGQPAAATARRVRKDGANPNLTRQAVVSTEKTELHRAPAPDVYTSVSSPSDGVSGEELFNRARALYHLPIPDFNADGPYLELLGASAAAGYAPALAKLGEYAIRRAAWVEAYYWMKQAQRQGMENAEAVLRKIRMHWSQEGFPRQSSNVNKLFTEEAGRIGRAFLRVDSGHEAARGREFLAKNHPEFLSPSRVS